MESSHIYLESVLGICTALFIGSILFLLSKRFKFIPYTVLLLVLGVALSPLHLEIFERIRLTPGSVMFIFLPILLFESAFNFNFKEFRRILAPGFILASIGLLLCAFIIAITLNILFKIPLLDAYMFGAVISSTDPIAVLTIFKQLGVPKKLQLLVDGESFINDATSVIMFRILSALTVGATASIEKSQIISGSFNFIVVLVGGVLVGAVLGWIFSELISRIKNVSAVEITLTIIFAHLVFILAEDIFHVSGIIAVLVGGLILGNYGRTKISPRVSHNMHQMWDMLIFLSTSIIFLLIGYEINLAALTNNFELVIAGTLALLIGRALSVYLLLPIYNLFTSKNQKIPFSWMHIANWGGLRGVLPLIVILSLPETYEYRETFIELVLGAILFTLIINALTIKPLIRLLKLDKLATAHEIEIKVTEAFVLKELLIHFDKLRKLDEIGEDTYQENKKKIENKLRISSQQLDIWSKNRSGEYNKEMEHVLRRYCLQIEKAIYAKYFKSEIISEKIYNRLKESIYSQIENIDENKEQFEYLADIEQIQGKVGSVKLKPSLVDKLKARFGLIKNLEEETLKDYYIYHKMRLLGDEKVLEELEDYSKAEIFSTKVLAKIFDFYKDLYYHNRSTLEVLEKLNKKETHEVEELLLTHESKFIVDHILEEFGEEDRISTKAMQNIDLKL